MPNRKRQRRSAADSVQSAPVQSISRALRLLSRLADHPDGTALGDIAKQVGLAPSTAHRLLSTLQQEGFAEHDGENGDWRIGVTAFTVGNAYLAGRSIAAHSRAVARQLMETTGETVNLGVLQDGAGVIILQTECRELMRMVVPLGSRVPLHASGIGKALLSTLTPADVDTILHTHGLSRFTEFTLDKPAELHAALTETRKRGFTIDNEEHAVGLRCVAAPVFNQHGDAEAALSVSGPKSRISTARLPELGAQVRDAAREISARIGAPLVTG